jgi:hypothetical protein
MLVNRVSNLDLTWRQEMDELTNRASPTLELTLDDLGLRRNIDQLTFLEMKRNIYWSARLDIYVQLHYVVYFSRR